MERREIVELIKEINLYYGLRGKNAEDIRKWVDQWEIPLKNIKAETAMANLKKHIQASEYPPNLSALVKVPQESERSVVPGADQTKEMLDRYKQPEGCTWEEVEAELEKLRRIVGLVE